MRLLLAVLLAIGVATSAQAARIEPGIACTTPFEFVEFGDYQDDPTKILSLLVEKVQDGRCVLIPAETEVELDADDLFGFAAIHYNGRQYFTLAEWVKK